MFSAISQVSARQRDIIEVVFRNGWDYMRRLLTGGKVDEPQLPPPAILRKVLIELGPVYIKLGQLLSTRPDLLPAAYIEVLTTLQAEVPPIPWDEVETVIRQQLTLPIDQTFDNINSVPVAAGSIAQTHKAVLQDGREVALKIQRPGIDATIAQDITLIRGLAVLVAQTEFGQTYNVIALAEEFTSALRAELDFTQEASYTDQLRQNLSTSGWFDPAQVTVPQIYWQLTTQKLLVMEWLNGEALLQGAFNNSVYAGDASAEKRAIATLIVRVFFQQFCIDGFFHADPHPGNLFYIHDHRLALLDCGMMGRLDPRTQQLLIELLLAIVNMDAQRCSQLTLQLAPASKSVDLAKLESEYDRLLRQYYSLNLSQLNFSQLFYDVLQTARNNKLRLPGNLGLCAKALTNLEGVCRQLDPTFNFVEQIKPLMTDVFRRQLIGDAPVEALLRTVLDLKSLSLQSPRQIELLLDRVTSETLKWNFSLQGMDGMRRSVDDSANRLSFSIVVGSLIIGAAVISSQTPISQVYWLSAVLFGVASFLGLWLIFSILRSGRLKNR